MMLKLRKLKTRNERPKQREAIPGEIWKSVSGYDGLYEISSLGRVYSLPKEVPWYGTFKSYPGRLLKDGYCRGYRTVILHKNGIPENARVHRLVADAFCEKKTGPYVRHLNGVPYDNRAENLSWGTQQDNMDDARRHGSFKRGEDKYNSRLTEELVRKIRSEYKPWKVSQGFLSKKYGISKGTLRQALHGLTWSHVK